jgi:hemoglobin-like flavoprotein
MSLNVDALEQSFDQIRPNATEFVSSFYSTLFADYPDTKLLFAHMAVQKKMLLNALVFIVENLRQPAVLTQRLQGLGAAHAGYGALPEHYPLVDMTLLKTVESYSGRSWTPEVRQSWVEGYGAIAQLMPDGATYPNEILQLNQV